MAKQRNEGRATSQTRSFWRTHYQQWLHSGLSKADYCREHGLYAGTFYNWCHTFAKTNEPDVDSELKCEALELIPVTVQHDSPSRGDVEDTTVTISCAALTLTLPADLQCEQINRWLGTMASLYV